MCRKLHYKFLNCQHTASESVSCGYSADAPPHPVSEDWKQRDTRCLGCEEVARRMHSGWRSLAALIMPNMPYEYVLHGIIPRPMQVAAETIMVEVQRQLNTAEKEDRDDILDGFLDINPLMPMNYPSFDATRSEKAKPQQAPSYSKLSCHNDVHQPPANNVSKAAMRPSETQPHAYRPSSSRQALGVRSANVPHPAPNTVAGMQPWIEPLHPLNAKSHNIASPYAFPTPQEQYLSGPISRDTPTCPPTSRMYYGRLYEPPPPPTSTKKMTQPVPPATMSPSENWAAPGIRSQACRETGRTTPQTPHFSSSAARNPGLRPTSRVPTAQPYAPAADSFKKTVVWDQNVGVRRFDKELSAESVSQEQEQRAAMKRAHSAVIWD